MEQNNSARIINPDDMICTREVATLLGVAKSSVIRRVNAGQIPVLKRIDGYKGLLIFDRHDVLAHARLQNAEVQK